MEVQPHHVKQEVYTCAQESKYLIATNIPSIGAHNELAKLFSIYGSIEEHKMLDEYPCEANCETMLVKFARIPYARTAKIKMDNYNFYGGSLHVFYAPEFESIEDVREKLSERRTIIAAKVAKYDEMKFGTLEYDLMGKKEPYKRIGLNKKPKKSEQKATQKSSESDTNLMQPQLPPNWAKPSETGSHSYDETVHEINKRLEATLSHQQDVSVVPKKRRKLVQL